MNGHGGRKDAARRRRQSEQRAGGGNIYRMALEAARDAILIVSPEGVIIDVNAACMAALGYESKGQLVGKSVFDAVTIEGADELRENVVRALREQGSVASLEAVVFTAGGRDLPVEMSASPLVGDRREPVGVVLIVRDITERKRAEHEVLRHSKRVEALHAISIAVNQTRDLDEMLRSVLEKVLEVMAMDGGHIHLFNQEMTELVLAAYRGIPEKHAVAVARIEVDRETRERWLKQAGPVFCMRELLAGVALNEVRNVTCKRRLEAFVAVPLWFKSGMQGWLTLVGRTPRGFAGDELELLQTIGSEIAAGVENARLLEKTIELSITDELTKLYNRRHLYEVLDLEMNRTLRYGRPFAVAMVDLDGFKEYNDKFGHANGDAVLKSFAEALRASLRRTDVGFRYGGDEFVIILPATDAARARKVVDRVRSEWLQAPKAENLVLESQLGFSVGISQFPDDAETADDLLSLADAALYHSKRTGGYRTTLVSDLADSASEESG